MWRWMALAAVAGVGGCRTCDPPAWTPESRTLAMPTEDFEAIVGTEGLVDAAVTASCDELCASVAEEEGVAIEECRAEERDSRTWEVTCEYRVAGGYCL